MNCWPRRLKPALREEGRPVPGYLARRRGSHVGTAGGAGKLDLGLESDLGHPRRLGLAVPGERWTEDPPSLCRSVKKENGLGLLPGVLGLRGLEVNILASVRSVFAG